MMTTRALLLSLTILLVHNATPAMAQSESDEDRAETLAGGAWHAGPFVPCADGKVTSVHPRLDEPKVNGVITFESGVAVEMALPTAPRFLNGQAFHEATVVHYDGDPSNKAMQGEKPGSRVQVCFIAFPTPTHDPKTGQVFCDPNNDPRGMTFRVYDYARHVAFMGPNSQHGCGGA
jgi:hypothetical protein